MSKPNTALTFSLFISYSLCNVTHLLKYVELLIFEKTLNYICKKF